MKKTVITLLTILVLAFGVGKASATVTSDAGLSLDLAADVTSVGTQNNLALPAGSATRFNGVSVATWTGIAAPANSRMLIVHNISGVDLTINHLDALSAVGNRFNTATGAAIVVPSGSSVVFQYDLTGTVWRMFGAPGRGIASLNGLLPVTQTFANGATGTTPNIVSSGSVHTFNQPLAGPGVTSGDISNAAQTIDGAKTLTGATVLSAAGTALTVTNNSTFSGTIGVTGLSTLAAVTTTGVAAIGDGTATVAINSSDWDITVTGVMTGIGNITMDGAYTQSGTGANALTGATTLSAAGTALTVTNNSSFGGTVGVTGLTTLAALTSTGVAAIGNGSATVAIDSSDWDITTTGIMTGIGNISSDGGYTQSGTSINTLTGATTLSSAGTALSVTNNATIGGTLGVTGVATFTAQSVFSAGASTVGNIVPSADNTQAVGTGALRFASGRFVSMTTGDLNLEQEKYGSWILREGKSGMYAFNKLTKKSYQISMKPMKQSRTSFWDNIDSEGNKLK